MKTIMRMVRASVQSHNDRGERERSRGFALPTILIASIVMITVMLTAIQTGVSVRVAMDKQYANVLSQEATESGLAYARACLEANNYIATWSTASPLRPNTDCSGVVTGGSEWLVSSTNMRTTFTVGSTTGTGTQQFIPSEGTVEFLRTSNGVPWKTTTSKSSVRAGANLDLNMVKFAYAGGYGSYFLTIASDGNLRGVGYNGWGMLGNASYATSLTPVTFQLASGLKPASFYTNFVSQAYNTFVIADNGVVYGVGYNGQGQLGDGTTTTRNQATNATSHRFQLPAGKVGAHVLVGGYNTFVLSTDGNVYAAGECDNGRLGSNYTIAGCVDRSVPVRVNLPAVTADPNTIATSKMTTDYQSTYVIMQGGRVYGWGRGAFGKFGNNSAADISNPVQVGTFGNSGQPKAVDIKTDGDSVWILDDAGALWGLGYNDYGQLAGTGVRIYHGGTGQCFNNTGGDNVTIALAACYANATPDVRQQFTFRTDGSIYYNSGNRCLNNTSGDGITLGLAACTGAANQSFKFRSDRRIQHLSSGKCIENSGSTLLLSPCGGTGGQTFYNPEVWQPVRFYLPASAGTVTKFWVDQWQVSALTSSGDVWSAGLNEQGQLGNGETSSFQPAPVKFPLPGGVTATNVYTSTYNTYQNVFVVGSDGKVYGAGDNATGQLGDGTTTDRTTPVPMLTINGTGVRAKEVQSGWGTTIILTENSKLYTVGNNAHGQLGDGTTTNSSTPKANQYTNVVPPIYF